MFSRKRFQMILNISSYFKNKQLFHIYQILFLFLFLTPKLSTALGVEYCLGCRSKNNLHLRVWISESSVIASVWKSTFENDFFRANNFFPDFGFKNGCKNEFKDKSEKSCSWSRNRISPEIESKAVFPRSGHADSVGVKKKNELFVGQWSNKLS